MKEIREAHEDGCRCRKDLLKTSGRKEKNWEGHARNESGNSGGNQKKGRGGRSGVKLFSQLLAEGPQKRSSKTRKKLGRIIAGPTTPVTGG